MKQLAKKLKKLLKTHKDVEDLIIFGSKSKGRIKNADIDIAALTNTSTTRNKLKKDVVKLLSHEVDLQLITYKDYTSRLWITLIREGFSVKHGKYLYDMHGIKPVVLYKYSLKELTASKKVMFDRAIKNFEGVEKLSNSVVLVPISISGEFDDFLRGWNLDIDTMSYGLLPLMRKEEN